LNLGSSMSVRTMCRLGSSLSVSADGKIYDAHVTNILTVSQAAQMGSSFSAREKQKLALH
jgi:hypothetical protein